MLICHSRRGALVSRDENLLEVSHTALDHDAEGYGDRGDVRVHFVCDC
jgi:hypothetical protein